MKRPPMLLVSLFAILLSTLAAAAQGHHEALSAEQLGSVSFPTSCADNVQKPFERGVALLHSFWYEEAEKQFAEVAKNDSHCAMAHWGSSIATASRITWPAPQLIQLPWASSIGIIPATTRPERFLRCRCWLPSHRTTRLSPIAKKRSLC